MRKTMRFLKKTTALLLCVAMLFGGSTVFALEEAVRSVSDAIALGAEGGRELSLLLDDIENFSAFSDKEKEKIYEFLSNGDSSFISSDSNVEVSEPVVAANKEKEQTASKNIRASRDEIYYLTKNYGKWSETPENARKSIFSFIGARDDAAMLVDKLLLKMESAGLDVYESVLRVRMLSFGIFSAEEVEQIFARYPQRLLRESKFEEFYYFSLHFDIGNIISDNSFTKNDMLSVMHSTYTEEQLSLREKYADVLSESAYSYAKRLFLSGADTGDIETALIALGASGSGIPVATLGPVRIEDLSAVYKTQNGTKTVTATVRGGNVSAFADGEALSSDSAVEISVLGNKYSASIGALEEAASVFTSGNAVTRAALLGLGDDENTAPPVYISIDGNSCISANTYLPVQQYRVISLPGPDGAELSLDITFDTYGDPSYWTYADPYYVVEAVRYTYGIDEEGEYEYSEGVLDVYRSSAEAVAAYNELMAENGDNGYDENGYAYEVGVDAELTYYEGQYIILETNNAVRLGDGWTYELPYIEFHPQNGRPMYLCRLTKSSYSIYEDSPHYPDSLLSAPASYYKFENCTTHTNLYGTVSAYKYVLYNGTELYFNRSGRLISEIYLSGYTVAYNFGNGYLSGIKDSFGRELVITNGAASKTFVYKPNANADGTTVAVIELADWDITVEMHKVVSAITDANGVRRSYTYSLEETLISDGYSGYTDDSCGFPAITSIDYSTGASLDFQIVGYSIDHEYETEEGIGECSSRYAVTGGITYTYTENGSVVQALVFDTEYTEHDGWDQIGIKSVKLISPDGSFCVVDTESISRYTSGDNGKLWYSYYESRDSKGLPGSIHNEYYGYGTVDTVRSFNYDKYDNVYWYIDEHGIHTFSTYYTKDDFADLARLNIPKTESYSFTVNGTTHTVLTEYALTANLKNVAAKTVKLDGVLLAKTEYAYDSNENLVRLTEHITLGDEPQTRETLYSYTDSDTERGWDGLYLTSVTVTGLCDADGTALADAVTRYEYDDFGNLSAHYDANGNKTVFEYDISGNLTAEKRYTLQNSVYTLYSTESYVRNYTANDLTHTDVKGNAYLYDYDPFGRLLSVIRTVPGGTPVAVESYTYDNCGRVSTLTTAAGSDASFKTVYYYDERGELQKTRVFAYGADISTPAPIREEYTEFINETVDGTLSCVGYRTVVSGLGTAENSYEEYRTDKYGQVTEKRVYFGNTPSAEGQVTRYTYDVFGRKVTESYVADNGAELVTASYAYDVFGNTVSVTDVFGNTATAQYDAIGRRISDTDAKGIVTEYKYDALDRAIEVRKPLDVNAGVYSISRTYYDAAGNVIKTKQSNNADNSAAITYAQKEYVYDSLNRVSDAYTGGGWLHYGYDVADKVTHIYSGMTAQWTAALSANAYSLVRYEYDSLGNAVKLTDELGNAETYTYDVLGLLTKTVQRNGNYITYAYDALGNVLTETAHSAAGAVLGTVANTYDAMGRTLTRSAGGNTDSYTYAKGQVVTAVTGGTVEKTYGRNGNVLSYTLKDGTNTLADSASYEYDNALRLSAVTNYDATSGEALYTVSYTYDENGNRLIEESTAGTEVYYLYNDANLVRSMINYARDAWNDPVITEAYTYGYYTDGNQRMKMDGVSGKKTVYVYDAAGRLISETESVSGTVTQAYVYTYDASGNRLSLTATGNEAYTVNYTYDKANRLLTEARTENGTTETKTYTYDQNGNLLTITSNGTVLESYTYDAFGKMVSYTKNGTTTSYTYRPDGLLYTKQMGTDASTKKYFVFSDGQMVYEQTGTDNIGAVIYSYGLTRISAKSRESLAESQEILYYYLYNAHGDVVRIIGADRITVTTYDYDAFGNDRNALETDTNPFRYCGEYFDTATQTYFLRARWYDPATGRFTQQDSWAYYNPNDPLSLNLYVYCYGNPVGYVDYLGRSPWEIYRYFHRKVQEHIAGNEFFYEKKITFVDSSYGRVDLIQYHDGKIEIWEIKHLTEHIRDAIIARALNQLSIYKSGKFSQSFYDFMGVPEDAKKEDGLIVLGGPIEGSSFKTTFGGDEYTVSYESSGHGIILYTFSKILKDSKPTLETNDEKVTKVATLMMLSTLASALGGATKGPRQVQYSEDVNIYD